MKSLTKEGEFMARPKKEGLDYFPHDTDSVNDEKIEALRLLYGNDGYAFYFILLERIYRTNNAELDVSDAETIQILARKVSVTEEKFRRMLETSLKRGCFDVEEYENRGVLTSNGIKKRASVVTKKRVTMRKKYKEEKEKSFLQVSDAETNTETGETKQKKSKEKNKDTSRSKLKFETHHMKLAELLYKLIRRNNPNAKEPNLESWANTFRLMMERDKRSGQQIQDLIIYTQDHDFWYKNILSPEKLRKQYDRLILEMQDDNQKLKVLKGGANHEGYQRKPETSYERKNSKYDFSKRNDL